MLENFAKQSQEADAWRSQAMHMLIIAHHH